MSKKRERLRIYLKTKTILVKEQLNHSIQDKIVLNVHISKHLRLVDPVLEE